MLKSPRNARRRQSVVCHILYLAIAFVCCAITVSLLVTNLHKFVSALSARRKAVQDNKWLLEQCRSAEFYSNMRQHSSVCDEVALTDSDTLWLHALRDVFDDMHPCGLASCEQHIVNALAWVFEKGVYMLCAMALAVFMLTMALLHTHRAFAQRKLGSAEYVYEDLAPYSALTSGICHNSLALSRRTPRNMISDM